MPIDRGALPTLFVATLFVATMDVPGNTCVGPHGPMGLRGSPVSVGRAEMASDPDLAKALWAKSESLTGVSWQL